ncbi:MAG TPA: hypothetical protein VK668_14790 [Mucilaginibacter sp.]|nr:hypothetical protein [Mucilaginibacter sp.]
MKRILFYLLILITVSTLSGCKKETPISTELAGSWELMADINGQTGKPTNYPAGNGHVLKFTATNYEVYENFKLTRSGTYAVKRDTIYTYNQLGNKISYDGSEDYHTFYTIENNQLSFGYDVNDGGGVVYRRVK